MILKNIILISCKLGRFEKLISAASKKLINLRVRYTINIKLFKNTWHYFQQAFEHLLRTCSEAGSMLVMTEYQSHNFAQGFYLMD